MLLPCFLAVSLFTILLCCSFSPIHSRPILALAGVFSVAMAIGSALGLLLLLGFRFNSVVLSMPFIIFCKQILFLKKVPNNISCCEKIKFAPKNLVIVGYF
jgi:hypothetical protein